MSAAIAEAAPDSKSFQHIFVESPGIVFPVEVEWLPLEEGWLGGYNFRLYVVYGPDDKVPVGRYWKHDLDPKTGTFMDVLTEIMADLGQTFSRFDNNQIVSFCEHIWYIILQERGVDLASQASTEGLEPDFQVNGLAKGDLRTFNVSVITDRRYLVFDRQVAVRPDDELTVETIAKMIMVYVDWKLENPDLVNEIALRIHLRILHGLV